MKLNTIAYAIVMITSLKGKIQQNLALMGGRDGELVGILKGSE